MDELNEKLDKLILKEIENVNSIEDKDEKSAAIEELTKLYKVRADQERNTNDFDVKIREVECRESELEVKKNELELKNTEIENRRDENLKEIKLRNDELKLKISDNDLKYRELTLKERESDCASANADKDRMIRLIVDGVEFFVPMIFYAIWLRKGFKFEETGVFKSSTFRGITSKFRPFKKWW